MAEPVHGTIALIPSACTSCMICVRECPCWCIDLHSKAVEIQPDGARRSRVVNQLESFTIDFGLCMYCGICIEVCPFDALAWREELTEAGSAATALLLGISELSDGAELPSDAQR
jgi:NADH-quinone oxidoreductase subunit I